MSSGMKKPATTYKVDSERLQKDDRFYSASFVDALQPYVLVNEEETHSARLERKGQHIRSPKMAITETKKVFGAKYSASPLISSVVPAVGRAEGGQTITLKGENLGERAEDIDAITIGGRACTSIVLVTTDAVVTCVTPPGVGSFVELQYRKATGVRTGGTGLF